MRPYRLATPAYRDLASELHYLNSIRDTLAGRFLSGLDERLRLVAKYPYMGRRRPEFGHPHLRFLVYRDYFIAYDPETKPLTVSAIRHSSRDPKHMFEESV